MAPSPVPVVASPVAPLSTIGSSSNPSLVDSGDRDLWSGWPAPWHVRHALTSMKTWGVLMLLCMVFFSFSTAFQSLPAWWHVGPALAFREGEIGLTSLQLCDTPSVDFKHARQASLVPPSCESENGLPHRRKGGQGWGRAGDRTWRHYLPASAHLMGTLDCGRPRLI